MPTKLLDTNIVSYIFKSHKLAALYRPHIQNVTLAVSFQTVGELQEGMFLANWKPSKRDSLASLLSHMQILHSDDSITSWWAEIRAMRKAQPIGVADAWIAATALAYDIELVTHNPKDFIDIAGLKVITEAK